MSSTFRRSDRGKVFLKERMGLLGIEGVTRLHASGNYFPDLSSPHE
jgi:hypothetical protein